MDTTRSAAQPATRPRPTVPDLLAAVYLVDVAAPGMEGLALWLAGAGADVTGSVPESEQHSPIVAALRQAGVRVVVGSDAGHLRTDHTAVVWSGVTVGSHPELDRARLLRLPILGRALALKAITLQAGPAVVAVAGSHSTATAAAALAAVLDDGETSWVLTAPAREGAAGHASGGRLVVDFCPDTATHEAAPPAGWQQRPASPVVRGEPGFAAALILSTDANAPHYEDAIEGLNAAERLARRAETVVLPTWDAGVGILRERLTCQPGPQVVTVGLNPDDTVWIMALLWTGDDYRATLRYQERNHTVVLPVVGRHHALAACAAVATALVLGEDPKAVVERAGRFAGVERSLALLGTQCGVTVVDSRARHPREVAADVMAARMLTEGEVVVVLEPDGIARTVAHGTALGTALGDADRAVLLPVSTPLASYHGHDPLDAVEQAALHALGQGTVNRIRSGPCEPAPEQRLYETTAQGDLVLVIGTGQAARLGPRLLFHLGAPTHRSRTSCDPPLPTWWRTSPSPPVSGPTSPALFPAALTLAPPA